MPVFFRLGEGAQFQGFNDCVQRIGWSLFQRNNARQERRPLLVDKAGQAHHAGQVAHAGIAAELVCQGVLQRPEFRQRTLIDHPVGVISSGRALDHRVRCKTGAHDGIDRGTIQIHEQRANTRHVCLGPALESYPIWYESELGDVFPTRNESEAG